MLTDQPRQRIRIAAALLVAAIEGALFWALLAGWVPLRQVRHVDELTLIRPTRIEPPHDRTVTRARRTARKKGAASPPNLRADPTEIVAPPPVLPPIPVPVAAAPRQGQGVEPSAGASTIPGPGTGAGGVGTGSGSGGDGNGDGDGGGDIPPRQIKGRLKNSDYPAAAGEAGVGGTVSVRYIVEIDGRVSDCEVTRSSGSRILDETTCRLIRERFRFRPSLDARGRPVPSAIVENHSWLVEREPDQPR